MEVLKCPVTFDSERPGFALDRRKAAAHTFYLLTAIEKTEDSGNI